jgi:hypothetical protein
LDTDLWPVMRKLEHDGAISKLLYKAILPLNSYSIRQQQVVQFDAKHTGVGNLCHLVTLEAIPALVASGVHELDNSQHNARFCKGFRGLTSIMSRG